MARALDRREARARLGPRAHRRVRRRSGAHRGHRRVGRRPPDRDARARRRATPGTSRASSTSTPGCPAPSRCTARTTSPRPSGGSIAASGAASPSGWERSSWARRQTRTSRPTVDASPVAHVDTKACPFLVVHGTLDNLVPVAQARRFVAALRDVGTRRHLRGACRAPHTRSTCSTRRGPSSGECGPPYRHRLVGVELARRRDRSRLRGR